ncbi:MAG: hypothetical protein AAGH83_04240 [Pseudomonadota bacterium]
MKPFLILAIGGLGVSIYGHAQAADTSTVMCAQFEVNGATYTVEPTEVLSQDFIPAHHAPRNIPIEVTLPDNVVSYIHFPIVEDGTYLVYATLPDRLVGLKKQDGTAIASTTVDAAESCATVLPGGLTADLELGEITHPTPVAIEFSAGPATAIRLIVSRNPIN